MTFGIITHKVFFVKWHTNDLGGIFGKKTYAHIDGSAVKGFLDFIRIPFKETDGNAGMFFVKNLRTEGSRTWVLTWVLPTVREPPIKPLMSKSSFCRSLSRVSNSAALFFR